MSAAQPELLVQASAEISTVLPATPERAFAIWTEAEHLLKWWGRFSGYTPERISSDTRSGGKYEIVMRAADGAQYRIFGEYERFDPPRSLRYTWCFQRIGADGEPGAVTIKDSVVEVVFAPHPDGCAVQLRHSALPTAAECASVADGWSGALALGAEYLRNGSELSDRSAEELDAMENPARCRITLRTTVAAEAGEVFRWLTEANLLTRWFPLRAETEPRIGGAFRFEWNLCELGEHMKRGTFSEFEPGVKLAYDWYPWGWTLDGEPKGPAPEGWMTQVEWALEQADGGTQVTLAHCGWRPGPELEKLLIGHANGWEMYIGNLKSVMEGGPDLRADMRKQPDRPR